MLSCCDVKESLDWDVRASKQYKFERMPGVLTVQLKRFAFTAAGGGKITKNITFPERLVIPTGAQRPSLAHQAQEMLALLIVLYRVARSTCRNEREGAKL